MRIHCSTTLVGLLLGIPVAAATNVSTPITSNTTWTRAGSPYVLWATITVNSGATLTIEPGVTVQNYDGNLLANALAVDGSLVAQGTPENRITFTKGAQRNLGLVRAGNGGSIRLEYCDFVDAQGVGGIEASFDIRHCTFSGPTFPGSGIYMASPATPPTVVACTIANTVNAALDLLNVASGTFDSLHIVMSPTVDTSAITLISSSPVIRNSVIVGNGLAPAVFLAGNSRPVIENCVIDGGQECAVWCAASGDIPSMAGDSLRTTGTRLARLPLPGWVVREGDVMHRVSAPAGAIVEVRGSTCAVSGTWPALVPTVLLGTVTIAGGATVSIAPGAEIRNGGGSSTTYDITIQGTLAAAGTQSNPITFTRGSAASGDRFGTLNFGAGAGGILEWCRLLYANGVMFGGAVATVRHCTFLHGSLGLGIANPPAAPTVTGCVFENVDGDALMLYTASAGVLDSLVVRNSTGNGIVLDSASPRITNSVISGNAGYGILCQNNANPTIRGDSIYGNTGGGVRNETAAITVNAEMNWWGDATGPYHPTLNPSGSGNAVSNYVDFDPWIGGPTARQPRAGAGARQQSQQELVWVSGVLRWRVPPAETARLTIHDLAGRLVCTAVTRGTGSLTLGQIAGGEPYLAVLSSENGMERCLVVSGF